MVADGLACEEQMGGYLCRIHAAAQHAEDFHFPRSKTGRKRTLTTGLLAGRYEHSLGRFSAVMAG
jgi:hypothetical protein